MPLLFAAYASVFPRNAYAGTIFNFLLGLLAASIVHFWVLRHPPGKLRNLAACAIAILPVVFVTCDRPEALALVFFAIALAVAAKSTVRRPLLAGLLIALVFLAHPFAAIATGIWTSALTMRHNWNLSRKWLRSALQIGAMSLAAAVTLIPVALLYFFLDRDSLSRFAAHSLGMKSGLGVVLSASASKGFLDSIRFAAFNSGFPAPCTYALSLSSSFLLAVWSIGHRRELIAEEWFPIAAGLACTLVSVVLFPIQANYILLLAFLLPLGLLISARPRAILVKPALALVLFAVLINVPIAGLSLIAARRAAVLLSGCHSTA